MSRQIEELQQLLDEGYFPPEQDFEDLDVLPTHIPPNGAQLILRLISPRAQIEEILGDMAEQYARDYVRYGERQAKWLAYVDAIKSAGPLA